MRGKRVAKQNRLRCLFTNGPTSGGAAQYRAPALRLRADSFRQEVRSNLRSIPAVARHGVGAMTRGHRVSRNRAATVTRHPPGVVINDGVGHPNF
jgi:hypothetical protein